MRQLSWIIFLVLASVLLACGDADQGEMTGMQRAHGRHEREAFSARTQGDKSCSELPGLTD